MHRKEGGRAAAPHHRSSSHVSSPSLRRPGQPLPAYPSATPSSSRPSPRRMKGGLLLAAAGGAAIALSSTLATAFVLPPPPYMRKQQHARPLQVKTGNNYGPSSSSQPLPREVLADSVGNLRLAVRDALWRADDVIQAKVRPAVASFNDTAITERVMAALYQAVNTKARAKTAFAEPTIATFATVSSPPSPPSASASTATVGGGTSSGVLEKATMAATTAAVAVPPPPPPVTRVQPPPSPRMPPSSNKNDDEDKETKAKAEAAAPPATTPSTSTKSVTVVEKPAVTIPPPTAPQVVAPKAPAATTTSIPAAVPPATTAASSSTPRATAPPPPVKTAKQLVEEEARSTKPTSSASSTFAASVGAAVGAEEMEDPQVVRARSQRWAEDVVRRARQRSVEQAQAQAKATVVTRVADTGKAKRRREEEKAAERARKVKVLEAAARLRAERAAALAERERALVVMAAKEVKVEKEERAVNVAPAAAVSAKAPQPTVGALMAAAAKQAEAAVTKAEAVLPPTPVTAAAVPATAAAAVAPVAPVAVAPMRVVVEEEDPQADRTSVETMLRDSKEKAVEEWHRARSSSTTEGAVVQEDGVSSKAEQLEQRLVDEIRAGPGAGIRACVELLEQQQAQAKQVVSTEDEVGCRWDLAYSSQPVAPLFGMPRWLSRFLLAVSATVERSSGSSSSNDKVAVIYNAVFKIFSWLPRLRWTQRAAVTVDEQQQQVEVLSFPPRFHLGRLSFSLPRLFGKKNKSKEEPAVRLTNTCTYLGSTLKICRLARPAASDAAAEPLVAVYLRKDPALAFDDDAAVMAAPLSGRNNGGIRSPAVSKLFQRFNKRNAAMAA